MICLPLQSQARLCCRLTLGNKEVDAVFNLLHKCLGTLYCVYVFLLILFNVCFVTPTISRIT
jgi:hypothetical protein